MLLLTLTSSSFQLPLSTLKSKKPSLTTISPLESQQIQSHLILESTIRSSIEAATSSPNVVTILVRYKYLKNRIRNGILSMSNYGN